MDDHDSQSLLESIRSRMRTSALDPDAIAYLDWSERFEARWRRFDREADESDRVIEERRLVGASTELI
jgi:hypothetical protein